MVANPQVAPRKATHMPQKPHPTRVWATYDVDGSLIVVRDGEAGIRSVVFHDPFAAPTNTEEAA